MTTKTDVLTEEAWVSGIVGTNYVLMEEKGDESMDMVQAFRVIILNIVLCE